VDEDGDVIDVFQQATQVTEDTTIGAHSFAPHWPTGYVLERVAGMMDENLAAYYSGITVNIHPVSFADYARELAEGIWDLAYERNIPIVSAEKWLDFTQGRYAAELDSIRWDRQELAFTIDLPEAITGLTVFWFLHGQEVERVTVDGVEQDWMVAEVWGQPCVMLSLDGVAANAYVEVAFT
jgi:hypothetical protein